MCRIAVISGFLGSGKTTTIIQLGRMLRLRYGKKIAIVVNEIGEVDVDGKFIRDFGLDVKEILGGCICCSVRQDLVTTIKTLLTSFNPDIILIEPTGIALPQQIVNMVSALALEHEHISLAPVIVLVDGVRFREVLRELKDFLLHQIKEAEVVGINKIDSIDRKFELELLKSTLREINPRATILPFSAKSGDGLNSLLSVVLFNGRIQKYVVMQEELSSTNSGISGCGVEACVKLKETINELSLKLIISELINKIAEEALKARGSLIGHIKAHIRTISGSLKASLVSIEAGVDFLGNIEDNIKDFQLTLFATVKNLHHDEIKHVIEDSLYKCIEKYALTLEYFEKHH